jgi:hypothetical protein
MAGPLFAGPGFVVESVGPPFGPHQDAHDYFEIPPPRLPAAPPGDPVADAFGRDLRLLEGDIVIDGNGDATLTRGSEAVYKAIGRALVIRPGELPWRPDFGAGLQDFLNLPGNEENLSEMRNRIDRTVLSFTAVDEILNRSVEIPIESESPAVRIHLKLRVAGQPQSIALQVRAA